MFERVDGKYRESEHALVDRFQVPARARRVPKAAVSAAPWWRNQRPIGSVSHRQAAGVPAHRGPLKVRQSTPLSPCHHRRGRTTRGSREMHWPTSGRACSQREPRRRRRPQSYSPPIPRHRHRRTLTPTTQQLAAAACTSIEQLVHHRGCLSASCSDARRREFVDNFRRTRSAYATRRPGRDQLGTPDTSRSGLPLARPDRHSACSNACPIPLLTANAPLRTVPKTSP